MNGLRHKDGMLGMWEFVLLKVNQASLFVSAIVSYFTSHTIHDLQRHQGKVPEALKLGN